MSRELRFSIATYPSGRDYYEVWVGDEKVGNIDIMDGGFQPFWARKPSSTLEDAARRMMEAKIRKIKKELARHEAWLKAIEESIRGGQDHGR